MNHELDANLESLRAQIVLGQECDAFFSTDAGRYVKARATEAVVNAIERLKKIDPADKVKVAQIQLEIKAADNALVWLNEAIQEGRLAYQQLEIMAENEGI